jgi:hypothetical protein
MFIRPITVSKNGKRHGYWALVESYRTSRGPRQRVVSYLGQADESLRHGIHQKATGKAHQRMLFGDVEPEWVEVNVNGIRVENCLDFGGPWLGLELLKRLGLTELFDNLIEEGLKKIEAACIRQKCDPVTIAKRVGRLLGQNSRAAGLFRTDVIKTADGRTKLLWDKVDAWRSWAALSEGCYMLRTNINDWSRCAKPQGWVMSRDGCLKDLARSEL